MNSPQSDNFSCKVSPSGGTDPDVPMATRHGLGGPKRGISADHDICSCEQISWSVLVSPFWASTSWAVCSMLRMTPFLIVFKLKSRGVAPAASPLDEVPLAQLPIVANCCRDQSVQRLISNKPFYDRGAASVSSHRGNPPAMLQAASYRQKLPAIR